jgi:hypothetical protein
MRSHFGLFAALALAGTMAGTATSPATIPTTVMAEERETRRRRRIVARGTLTKHKRAKNPPHKRKLKANRKHISKRVCRKHRRAA